MSTQHHDHHHDTVGHIVPVKYLVATGVALLILTGVTVTIAEIDFAKHDLVELNIWFAMGVATLKASLVCLFFMHLRWDRAFNSFIIVGSVAFVALFITFAMTDTFEYRHQIIPGDTAAVQQVLAGAETESIEERESGGGGGHGDAAPASHDDEHGSADDQSSHSSSDSVAQHAP